MILYCTPERLLNGSTGGFPNRCSHPSCTDAVGYAGLQISQGPRYWAFCSVGCAIGLMRLSQLSEVQSEDFFEAWSEGEI